MKNTHIGDAAFKKGGSAAFLVMSTFQLMCAMEAIHEFEIRDYKVIMTTFASYGPRNQQMLEYAAMFGIKMEQVDMASVDFDDFLLSTRASHQSSETFDRVFVGDSRCLNILVIASYYSHKGSVVVSLDDGTATIGVLKNIYYIEKPRYNWVEQYHWYQNKRFYNRRRNAIIKKLSDFGISFSCCFFTVFDDLGSSKDFVYRNQFKLLRQKSIADVPSCVNVVIIGTPVADLARVFSIDVLSLEKLVESKLKAIRLEHQEASIIYVPHPRDNNEYVHKACDQLGIAYEVLSEPVESFVLSQSRGIQAVYGFGSTALIVLKKILRDVRVVNIDFKFDNNLGIGKSRRAVSDYCIKCGIESEFLYIKTKRMNVLDNIALLLSKILLFFTSKYRK